MKQNKSWIIATLDVVIFTAPFLVTLLILVYASFMMEGK